MFERKTSWIVEGDEDANDGTIVCEVCAKRAWIEAVENDQPMLVTGPFLRSMATPVCDCK